MRLKTLTIKGFKSFATETVLNFNDDIIGVVGPNGSGKSNVVDAIRWVLGEQKSRELRLQSMTDVIFNGTKKRKQGASATVTLTFENDKGVLPSEYQTVAISRVLYRSGESEYRLNGVVCRLKDINSLLMDTGMGSNSYAIIALGMVDDILADKENARRRMFEQAAGISKYKVRKRETLNKLKGTTADLDRVEDLLFEIEGNLKSLEKQARRAQRYLDLKEKYKELSIQYSTLSIKSLKTEYKDVEQKLKAEQEKHGVLDGDLATKEAQLQKEKSQNLEKEQHVSKRQRQLGELNSSIRNRESEKDLLLQKKSFKKQTVANLERDLEKAAAEVKQFKKEIEILDTQLGGERAQSTKLTAKVAALSAEYEKTKEKYGVAKGDSDNISRRRDELSKAIFAAEKAIALAANNTSNAKEEIVRLEEELQVRKTANKSVKGSLTELQAEIKTRQSKLQSMLKGEEKRKADIAKLVTQRDTMLQEKAEVNRLLDSRQNEYDLLKSMVDNYEGFPESIKFLSTNWRSDIPVLSDLLEVADTYKGVIEQYLEPYLNHYVVDNADMAKEAIRLLTSSQQGKANFILLDHVPPGSNIIKPPVDMEAAREHVKVDDRYDDLLDHLLADVYIYTGDLEEFLPDETATYLSQTGTFLGGSMVITGGSVGLFEGKKIGRKKNLEKLIKIIDTTEKKKQKLETKLEAIAEKLADSRSKNADADIKALTREINELEQNEVRLSMQSDSYKVFKKEQQAKVEVARTTIAQQEKLIKEQEKALQQTTKDLSELESNIENSSSELQLLSNALSKASETYNAENIEMIRHQNLVQGLERDLAYKKGRMQDQEKFLSQTTIRIRDEKAGIADIKAEVEKLEQGLLADYKKRDEYKSQLNEAEQKYFGARNAITAIEDDIKRLQRLQNQIRLLVQQLKDQYTDVKFKMTAVGERLKIEFGLTLNEVINREVEEDVDEEVLKEKVEKLKGRLSNYGDINPMAVEAYNEMKERYESISSQRADILEAKESLLSTIKEIETSATSLFMKAFEDIRTNFIEVFRSLFSEEDNCDLILENPEDPLSSRIEIIAKPKGKRPKSLSQLSGGEKTLTATALLFSLYLLKPAPFCIFDEVDAPLDDANIEKFNRIISKFSERSQFIIVTHNKATMAAVDVLYGVYMQEQGVSAVTPVDFRSFEGQEYLETIN